MLAKGSERASAPLLGVPHCNFYAEDLGQSHASFLVVGSVSGSSYEPTLVDSVGFLLVSLTPLAPTLKC